jgi:hypothetical protein
MTAPGTPPKPSAISGIAVNPIKPDPAITPKNAPLTTYKAITTKVPNMPPPIIPIFTKAKSITILLTTFEEGELCSTEGSTLLIAFFSRITLEITRLRAGEGCYNYPFFVGK